MNHSSSITGYRFLFCMIVLWAGCNRPTATTPTATTPTATTPSPTSSRSSESEADRDQSPLEQTAEAPEQPRTEDRAPTLVPSPPPASPSDPAALQLAGMNALESGEFDAAYDYARQAMRLNGDDPQVVFLMGMVLAQRHRFPEAIDMLDQVAATTPDARLPVLGQTADWLVRYGQWSEAEKRYQEFLRQVPDAAIAHRNLTILLLRQGRRLDALSHLDRLCHLGDVTESDLRSMLSITHPFAGDAEKEIFDPIGPLGTARAEIARGDWQSAKERLHQLSSRGPWESALYARASAVLDDQETLQQWISSTDDSVDVSPDAWFAKGVYATSAGESKIATRCFAEAVLLDPTDSQAYFKLSQNLTQSGETSSAEATRQRGEKIEATKTIGSQMAQSEERDQQSILQLSELLRQLGRPLESLGWRGVWLTYASTSGTVSHEQSQAILQQIVEQRALLLEQDRTRATAEEKLCDLEIASLPTPEEINNRLQQLTPQ